MKFGMVVINSKMTTIVNNFKLDLLARELSSVFPARSFSNKFAQLQRLARKLKFHNGKYRYDTIQRGNNKGAEQTAQMHRLVCAFVLRNLALKISHL